MVLYKINMDLSIIIPARNEEFLRRTIEDILQNIEGETEIIAVCDGYWPSPAIQDHPRVTLIHNTEPRGQRGAQNQACRLSRAKYVMKVDAHCAFDKGFDTKMMAEMQDDMTMVPVMRNLHAFNWVCQDCGHSRYQGPSGVCKECGGATYKEIKWIGKSNPQSTSYCFDTTLHFQYFNEFKKRPEGKGDLTESMSLQGSCFMMTRENYWKWNVCDESWGSWGQQGVEVALKTWFNGGRVICNHKTWYAHMFRTQGGDFSFPYENPESKIKKIRQKSRDLFFNWKGERDLNWLVKKFNPPYWKKGIVYYTDNKLNMKIARTCREQLKKSGLPIVSTSLKPLHFGKNIHLNLQRGKLTMFKQILAGLEASDADIIFFCEHDVLYHPSHFDFNPPRKDVYYYNNNNYRLKLSDGLAVKYDHKATSQLCASRELLITEYKERVRRVETEGYNRKMGFEPGTRGKRRGGFIDGKSETWESAEPNIDIRHESNLTASKWRPEDFLQKRSCRNWQNNNLANLWAKDILNG